MSKRPSSNPSLPSLDLLESGGTRAFESLKLGGVVELGHLSSTTQFVILSMGVFVCYILHGYYQERLFSAGFRVFGFTVSLFDFIMFSVLAGGQLFAIKGYVPKTVPLVHFFWIAIVLAVSLGSGFASLAYLDYPTKVLFKSGKIIPTMLLGTVITKRSYSKLEYLAGVMLCVGLAYFTIGAKSVSPNFHMTGVMLVSIATLAEAVVSNIQEKVFVQYECTLLEMICWSNMFSAAITLVYVLATGELFRALAFIAVNPSYISAILGEILFGYIGIHFYLSLVKSFGAVITIIVAAVRKVITIVISFIIFPKPFTMIYVYGGSLVFLSLFLNGYAKNRKAFEEFMSGRSSLLHKKHHVI